MAEEAPRGSYAIKYVCMYVCKFLIFKVFTVYNTLYKRYSII